MTVEPSVPEDVPTDFGHADAISIDLAWNATSRDRTAIATRAEDTIQVSRVFGDNEVLVAHVARMAERGALVLVDAPLEGVQGLSAERPWRRVDERLLKIGIPLLPSVKAGSRGPDLRRRLLERRPDLVIHESYPYAVLRVIHALDVLTIPFDFEAKVEVDVSEVWWRWPPRYKRASGKTKRAVAMRAVADLLTNLPLFARAVCAPEGCTRSAMALLADEYDALLGLAAAVALKDGSPWSWTARCEGASIVSIADVFVRRRFDAQR